MKQTKGTVKLKGFPIRKRSISFHPLGMCPRVRVRCEIEERNLCTKSRQCPEKMKCCRFSCGKKCVNVRQDICTLPKEPGPCMAYLPRWWYHQENEACSKFIYGSCQGNNNNFQSEAVCRAICPKRSLTFSSNLITDSFSFSR
uniref:Eppin n=1 Tax=Balaenoptera musculus TaxID=9771 RepID=A0A8C0I1U4_BALMU